MSDIVTGNENTVSLQRPPNVCNYRPLCQEKTYHAGAHSCEATQPQLHAQVQLAARLKIYSQQADAHTTHIHHWPHQSQTHRALTPTASSCSSLWLEHTRLQPNSTAGTHHHTELAGTPWSPSTQAHWSFAHRDTQAHTCLTPWRPSDPTVSPAAGQDSLVPPTASSSRGLALRDTRSPPSSHLIHPLTRWSSLIFASSHTLPHTPTLAPVLQHR